MAHGIWHTEIRRFLFQILWTWNHSMWSPFLKLNSGTVNLVQARIFYKERVDEPVPTTGSTRIELQSQQIQEETFSFESQVSSQLWWIYTNSGKGLPLGVSSLRTENSLGKIRCQKGAPWALGWHPENQTWLAGKSHVQFEIHVQQVHVPNRKRLAKRSLLWWRWTSLLYIKEILNVGLRSGLLGHFKYGKSMCF